MFELVEVDCKIAHLNIREEKHGEEPVLAIDLKLQADLPNKRLDDVSPGLLASLYTSDDAAEQLFEDGHLPKLRHTMLQPLKLNLGEIKVEATIHRVTHDVKLDGVVKKLMLECKAGGTVTAIWTISCTPEADVVGKLSAMLGNDQTVSMLIVKPEADGV